ncbi:hypothetical protein [Aureivirga sp. CE67]|nr:hypothetical protein [Aureivirga sp. CE67]
MSIKNLIQKQKEANIPKKKRVNIEAKVNANRVGKKEEKKEEEK